MSALFSQGDGTMTLKDLVEQFCIKRLAEVLWECVECSTADRTEFDWLTAERFVKKNPSLVSRALTAFVFGQAPADTPVEDLPFDIGYDTFVVKCGRTIWSYFYQPLQKQLNLPFYPVPHYTYVRFG
jgi:hypothetical protein